VKIRRNSPCLLSLGLRHQRVLPLLTKLVEFRTENEQLRQSVSCSAVFTDISITVGLCASCYSVHLRRALRAPQKPLLPATRPESAQGRAKTPRFSANPRIRSKKNTGLNYVTACACLHDTSMLASMIHLWATIRGLSLLVTTSLSVLDNEHLFAGSPLTSNRPIAVHKLQESTELSRCLAATATLPYCIPSHEVPL
jgi:hypothetical protein